MKTCNNKKSGKTFICVDVSNNGMRLMISPNGDVKALEKRLFTDPVEGEEPETLLEQGLISKEQYKVYIAYYQ
jgi:hypothetical protein